MRDSKDAQVEKDRCTGQKANGQVAREHHNDEKQRVGISEKDY